MPRRWAHDGGIGPGGTKLAAFQPRAFVVVAVALLSVGCKSPQTSAAYEGCRMGECHRIFIHEREAAGNGRWRFRTRTAIRYDPRSGLLGGAGQRQRVELSSWEQADCDQSTINGELVPAIARSGVERGLPQLLQAICAER